MEYSSDKQSIYCYEGTSILINNYNIKDQDLLESLESDLTRKNLARISLNPIKGNFDLKHLQKIHKAIFKDIYPFAGKIRNEMISKDGMPFAFPLYISSNANRLFDELKSDNYLVNMPFDKFISRLAYYMSEINVIHPFREGNGRTNREFIRLLALNCKYEIDWENISKEDLLKASIESVKDTKLLEYAIKRIIRKL